MFGIGSPRPRKSPPRRTFQPRLDLLESRALPSGVNDIPPLILPPDPASVVSVSTERLRLARGGSATFTLVLNRAPSAVVDITLAQYAKPPFEPDGQVGGPATKLTLSQSHLAFTQDNWDDPQTVEVTAPASEVPLPEERIWVFGTTTSADAAFDAQAVPPVTVHLAAQVRTGGITVSAERVHVQPGGPPATYTLVLTSRPSADVIVEVSQPGLTPPPLPGEPRGNGAIVVGWPLTISPERLVFTSDNWSTPQTISVAASHTDMSPWGQAWLILEHHVASADPNYARLQVPSVTVEVDHRPTGSVVYSTQELELVRGGEARTYTIALGSQPSADVRIALSEDAPWMLASDAATAMGMPWQQEPLLDIRPTEVTFTSDNWSTPQTIAVAARPGSSPWGSDYRSIFHSSASEDPNYSHLWAPTVAVNIKNNPAFGIVLSKQQLEVTRGGEGDSYTIALASQPAADVVIRVTQGRAEVWPMADARVSATIWPGPSPVPEDPLGIEPQALTFTRDNWDQPQTVRVAPPATGIGDQYSWLEHSSTSADPNFTDLRLTQVNVHVVDPVKAGVLLSAERVVLQRGGDPVSYTVRLATQPTAVVEITVESINAIAFPAGTSLWEGPIPAPPLQIEPHTLRFTPDNWDQPQTVTLSAPADDNVRHGGFVLLQHTIASDDAHYKQMIPPTLAVHVEHKTEPVGGLVVSAERLELHAGGSARYTIALARKPTANVTVIIEERLDGPRPLPMLPADGQPNIMPPADGAALGIEPARLVFTPENWDQPQTVTVTSLVFIDAASASQVEALVHRVESDDPAYNGIAVPPVLVFVGAGGMPPIMPPARGDGVANSPRGEAGTPPPARPVEPAPVPPTSTPAASTPPVKPARKVRRRPVRPTVQPNKRGAQVRAPLQKGNQTRVKKHPKPIVGATKRGGQKNGKKPLLPAGKKAPGAALRPVKKKPGVKRR